GEGFPCGREDAGQEAPAVGATSRVEFDMARLSLETLRANEEMVYYYVRGPRRCSDARDAGSALVLDTLRRLHFLEARTVVWAANAHITRDYAALSAVDSPWVRSNTLGWHLVKKYGVGYVPIALTAHQARGRGLFSLDFIDYPIPANDSFERIV